MQMSAPVLAADYQVELTHLLDHVARTATAIRQYSAYGNASHAPQAPAFDLYWLSDSLHNLDMLAGAIRRGEPADILLACDMLIHAYERYGTDIRINDQLGPETSSQAAFERNARIHLPQALETFRAIRRKAAALATEAPREHEPDYLLDGRPCNLYEGA